MNPNGSNGGNIGVGAPEPVGNPAVNPLGNLEDIVAKARAEAAAPAESPTEPVATTAPAGTPRDQFKAQFGPDEATPVTETPVATDEKSSVAPQIVDNSTPAAEAEGQTPQDKFRQTVSDAVDTLLEEVTKEKAAV